MNIERIKARNYSVMAIIALAILALLLCSCADRDYYHGYSFKDLENCNAKIKSIKKGATSEIDILKIFGSPSIVSVDGDRAFIYMESSGKIKPIIDESQDTLKVLYIAFDNKHIVSSVIYDEYIGGHHFEYHDGATEVDSIKNKSFVEQLLHSFKKFSAMKPGETATGATGK